MNVGLIDVDGHNFPNLALMRISAYHKARGDNVEWAYPIFGRYDRVYKSKVFTFTPDNYDYYSCEIVKGGTGYDIHSKLPEEIDRTNPDYTIYNIKDVSYGFLTRGCSNKCKWCIVPIKEGAVAPYRDIDEVAQGNKKIILMDNNILASDYGINQLIKISKRGYKVDFNQGIDARLITDETAKILASVKWIRYIRLACDTRSQIDAILNAHDLLAKYGYNKSVFCYFLIKDYDDCIQRLNVLRKYKWFDPFGQPYRDFTSNQKIPKWQKKMARWMNIKSIYRTIDFSDYLNNTHQNKNLIHDKGKNK